MITAFYAAILALLFLILTYGVIAGRLTKRIAFGTGGHDDMTKRVRAHANFAEFVPLALLLVMFSEMQAAPLWTIHLAGLLLVLSRLLHAWGIYHPVLDNWQRKAGALSTHIVILAAALWNIWVFVV